MEGIINIAGVIPRMGTTTLSLQLVRFLQESGYDACYVEMSRQDYIWGVMNIYAGVSMDRATGKTICMGIPMFPCERMEALREGKPAYDYIVCDFGNLSDTTFHKQQFIGGDCGILVCGNKPNEIFRTEDAIADPVLEDAVTVFNFTDPSDQAEIRAMMMDRGGTTDFMPYIPDPFHTGKEYAKEDFFQRLMDLVMGVIQSWRGRKEEEGG